MSAHTKALARFFGVVFAIAFIGFFALRTDIGQALFGHWSFVRSIQEDHGTYYRLKVKLAYRGEPQDFDIVVGCNVRQINYKDGSRTYEAGLVPTVFGRRMNDGKGLVVRPPRACEGQTTANGMVQPDLLPIVVVYDDADTLDFGTAYLSKDAYESPLSVLKFDGATIERATRADFDKFRKVETNLVTRQSYHSALTSDQDLKSLNFTRLVRSFGRLCSAYERVLIPAEVRDLVRQNWPVDRPNYWLPDSSEAEKQIRRALYESEKIQSDRSTDIPRRWDALSNRGNAERGLETRIGGGLVASRSLDVYPPAFYPATEDFIAHWWPLDWKQWPTFVANKSRFASSIVDFRNGMTRGFAYCGSGLRPTAEQRETFDLAGRKPRVFRVDGQDVASKRPVGAAGDTWIFERDESVFINLWFYLESTRGDV